MFRKGNKAIEESFIHLLDYLIDNFWTDAWSAMKAVGFPFLLAVLCFQLFALTCNKLYASLHPPGPKELHRKAMVTLRQSRKGCLEKTEKLLKQSIKQGGVNHQYAPSYFSLATLYMYRLRDFDQAVRVLKEAECCVSDPKELEPLMKEAKDLQARRRTLRMDREINEDLYLSVPPKPSSLMPPLTERTNTSYRKSDNSDEKTPAVSDDIQQMKEELSRLKEELNFSAPPKSSSIKSPSSKRKKTMNREKKNLKEDNNTNKKTR